MGGEWGVGASLAMEKAREAPPAGRAVGTAPGRLLPSAICWRPRAHLFVFPHWGWRPLFFIGGIPALLAIYVRLGIRESEVWERTRVKQWGQLGGADHLELEDLYAKDLRDDDG